MRLTICSYQSTEQAVAALAETRAESLQVHLLTVLALDLLSRQVVRVVIMVIGFRLLATVKHYQLLPILAYQDCDWWRANERYSPA
jgi:uncharacterized membrane protein YqjE